MAAEPLDDYINAVAKALALPVEETWRPAVRAAAQGGDPAAPSASASAQASTVAAPVY